MAFSLLSLGMVVLLASGQIKDYQLVKNVWAFTDGPAVPQVGSPSCPTPTDLHSHLKSELLEVEAACVFLFLTKGGFQVQNMIFDFFFFFTFNDCFF